MHATIGRFNDKLFLNSLKLSSFQKRNISQNGQKRVVITGMGALSPLGFNVQDSWKTVLGNFDNIQLFAPEHHITSF